MSGGITKTSFLVTVALAGMVLGACGQKKNGPTRDHAPMNKADVGTLVTVNPSQNQDLKDWATAQGFDVRPLYPSAGKFEVFAPESMVADAFPQAKTEQNSYVEMEPPQKAPTFSLDQCQMGATPPTALITPTNLVKRFMLAPVFIVGEGPFAFSSTGSKSADGKTTPEVLWNVQGPTGSMVNGKISQNGEIKFNADIPGEYRVYLVTRDKDGICNMNAVRFAVTYNEPFKGKKEAREFTPKDEETFSHLSVIEAQKAWARASGRDVVIAVVDTGVNYNHADLAQNVWVNKDEIPNNGIDDDKNGFVDDRTGWDFSLNDPYPIDDQGHGTHVASLAASAVHGVAREAKIMAVKSLNTFGGGDHGTLAAGIRYAVDNGADIINASFGSLGSPLGPPRELKEALDHAEKHGVIIIAASGNGDQKGIGYDIDEKPVYPAGMGHGNMITVAATKKDGSLTQYSNFGLVSVDVAAPGGSRVDGALMGAHYLPQRQVYMGHSGTSMATPVVAGLVALMKSAAPNATIAQIKKALIAGGDAKTALQFKLRSGKLVNATKALNLVQPELRVAGK